MTFTRNLSGFSNALLTAVLAIVDVALTGVAIFCSLVSLADEDWDCKAVIRELG